MMNIDAAVDDDDQDWIVKEEKWGKDCCWNGIHIIEFNIKKQPKVFPKLQNRSTLCTLATELCRCENKLANDDDDDDKWRNDHPESCSVGNDNGESGTLCAQFWAPGSTWHQTITSYLPFSGTDKLHKNQEILGKLSIACSCFGCSFKGLLIYYVIQLSGS